MTKALQVHLACRVALYIVACGRILLMTCHTCDGVIKDNNGRVALIVGYIDKTCYARVHKCRVADNAYGLVFCLSAACLVVAVKSRNGGAHAERHIKSVEWRH